MFLLSKLLPLFVLPLGISLILLLWGAARRRRGLVWSGIVVLLVGSNPFVGHYAVRTAEAWAERRPIATVAAAEAVVVLSAGRVVAPGPERFSEWYDPDRYFGGIELHRAGKARHLVFTGAWIDWEPNAKPEGEILRDYAISMGVPAEQILVTGRVANTADEAREVRRVLAADGAAQSRIILVTSAFHMPRARQVFEQAGMLVEPFPVDFWFSEGGGGWTPLDFLPSVGVLHQTQTALRELYGRLYYRLVR